MKNTIKRVFGSLSSTQQTVHRGRRPLIMPLEQRLMFDGAAVATAVDATLSADSMEPVEAPAAVETEVQEILSARGEGTEIVFIMGDTPDWQVLAQGVRDGVEVVVLNPVEDGLAQMAALLQGRENLSAIHLVSHGADAKLRLGTLTLDAQNLDTQADNLATIKVAAWV